MHPGQRTDLVHAPLADWAQSRPGTIAIQHGPHTLTFAQLHDLVTQRASALRQAQAPATVLVNQSLPITDRLVDFLGIVASGRCAALGDADWPLPVRQAVMATFPHTVTDVPAPQPATPFYVGYTSGSTGTPKGFVRHHLSWTSSFRACLEAFGPLAGGRILAPGSDSHSLFLFAMLLGLWSGAGVVVQTRFSAVAVLDTLRSGHTPCLVAVPSQLVLMLEVAGHRALTPIDGVQLILVSGSRWIRARTPALRALFPKARIIEFYGASETSFIAWMDSDEHAPTPVVGRPFHNVELQIRDPDSDGVGLIYVRSPMLFTHYVGTATDDTAALRDGDWLCVRDLGYLNAQGQLCLAGRQNRMLVTKGKNLFPEEVETVLAAHPAVSNVSVQGVDDPLRGLQVVAIFQVKPDVVAQGAPMPTPLQLTAWCRQSLEAYKAPRQYFVCDHWPLTASGKTDHRALADLLHRHLDVSAVHTPCLSLLH